MAGGLGDASNSGGKEVEKWTTGGETGEASSWGTEKMTLFFQ